MLQDLAVGLLLVILGMVIHHYYEKLKLHRKLRHIIDDTNQRLVHVSYLAKVTPGKSISNMKNILGEALIFRENDYNYDILTDLKNNNEHKGSQKNISTYIYQFKKTDIKITSRDNVEINSLTILPHRNQQISISDVIHEDIILNKTKISDDLLRGYIDDFLYSSIKDVFACLRLSYVNPHYKYTFFMYGNSDNITKYSTTRNYKDLIGATINGICVTSRYIDEIYYLFNTELN